MDICYFVREGSTNEELRYSMRSLSNLPSVGRVWIFGGAPSWINRDTVNYVPVKQHDFNFRDVALVKYENVRRNVWAACAHPEVSDNFLYMNDDFYVTEALTEIPILHYGNEETFLGFFSARQRVPSNYVLAEIANLAWLRKHGIQEPKSYALHVPLPVVKSDLLTVLDEAPWDLDGHPLHIRTVYGNLCGIGGEESRDVKVERGNVSGVRRMNGVRIDRPIPETKKLPTPFASSSDRSFIAFDVGRWVRAMFPTPSIYEV